MGYRPESRINGLLAELTNHGWLISGDAKALLTKPPDNVDQFVEELLPVIGSSPDLLRRADRVLIRRAVEDWVFDEQGRGAMSGLPLTA